MPTLETSLLAAIAPHDLLTHPFYRGWSMGALTRPDLAAYAAQYLHQVLALPELLRAAHDSTGEPAIERNLAEEEGRCGPAHAELWVRFMTALGAEPASASVETCESAAALRALCASGEIQALAALWAYELQTARVARTKREGLTEKYGVGEVSFFALHEELDVHHAADLLAAIERRCTDAGQIERACGAAQQSAQAQWRFLDGAERRRARC